MGSLSLTTLILLGILGLVGGVGITAIGPGGVLPTVGLFALTSLSPAQVAGTAIVTHVATGGLATAAYSRSGQLQDQQTRRLAIILAAAAAVGSPVGVGVNTMVSKKLFGLLLGVLLLVVALLVLLRERRATYGGRTHPGAVLAASLGFGVAVLSGIVGVGGPMVTVPLLVAIGVPVLESLAAAQVQSIIIASTGSIGYLAAGSINWPLAALVGVPELVGVLAGWKIAHALPTRVLKYVLVAALLVLAPYLALHG